MSEPLDYALNEAVLELARRKLPLGWKVTDDENLCTYENVCLSMDNNLLMPVWSGASERTIFGTPAVNWAFRAWHDWFHWRYVQPFTLQGEHTVANLQRRDVFHTFGQTEQTEQWANILFAEVMGQAEYEQLYGVFPDNQIGFVQAYLSDRFNALSTRWH